MYPPRFVPNFIKCNIHIPSIYLDTLYWPRFHRVRDESAFCTSVTTKSCAWETCSPPDYKTHAAAWTATEIPILIHLSFSRYVNDGRPFWQYIASSSTGCSDLEYFWGYCISTIQLKRWDTVCNQNGVWPSFGIDIFAKLIKCDLFARLGISVI